MTQSSLFADHIAGLQRTYEGALQTLQEHGATPAIDAVLIYSGTEDAYFGDDRAINFESYGHFLHWIPVNKPNQMLLFQPGKKPVYYQVVPTDFWYEQGVDNQPWWADQFEIVSLKSAEQVIDHLPAARRIAFLGADIGFASRIGMPQHLQNHTALRNYLDFYRGMKSDYELEQMREANRRGMICHQAALDAFNSFGSEYDIHQAYLAAQNMIEHDTPYTNIVALDEKGAILHYQGKRRSSGQDSKVLLIDAGVRVNGYASDITRTYAREDAHPVFRSLLAGMDKRHLQLIESVKPDTPYAEIHYAAHSAVLDLLVEHEIASGDRDQLEEAGISKLFFPHGIGHLLGLQVHDVGGHIDDEFGKPSPPPASHRFLRLNRKMRERMVFTVEPGLYFIPVLLDPERNTDTGKLLNWSLIDALTPFGGIRIEDNIQVTAGGSENLTR